ncbi:RNA polymerase II transcription factor B subunit 2 [Linderina pennispora]|uniref:RNA polymerase II transcription factor B subunit 2 n=1 Tax=Linderina pennispora TaxID=61395 RepID=A0A1Y1W5N4_9FUNG|nr:RNA polymerase II transcription factor B subunit 2 [Linderina pennispora]ORX68843.1 RNA polymerase II transcription factor B subunit 2 [Linderina pennispora]
MGSEGAFKSTIAEYLEDLPAQFCQQLFTKPAACLAIFRLLSTLGKHIIMSMLYLDAPIELTDVLQWAKPGKTKSFKSKIHRLRKLRILVENSGKVSLDPMFRQELRNALTGGGDFGSFGIPATTRDLRITEAWLEKYANEKWEAILHFMVGQNAEMPQPSDSVLHILKMSRLMERREGDMRITNSGFQFLLQDVSSQVWTVLLQYLRLAEDQNMDVVEVLNFLFQLVGLQLGIAYRTDRFSQSQRKMLSELKDFGLMYQQGDVFYPTQLVTSLTSAMNAEHTSNNGQVSTTEMSADGYVILETNCRVYAYTSSPLQIAILNLFVHLVSRFPNFVTGVITRDSIRRALSNGITADQIVTYMTVYAHPHMRNQMPVLPITVTDQIRLWENERNRLKPTASYFYKDFHQRQDFERVYKYAEDLGAILWCNIEKRQIVVTPAAHVVIMQYVRGHRKPEQRG